MNAPPEVVKALASLDGNRDWMVALGWLKAEYEQRSVDLLSAVNPVVVHQTQGYALCLLDIIRSATTATKVVSRLGDNQRMNTA